MENIEEKRQKAKKLREEKKYDAALPVFKELWDNDKTKDKWDGWGYAFCLNKTNNYAEAYKVSRVVYEIDKSFDFIKGTFAFSSFMFNVKDYPDTEPSEKLEVFVNEIVEVAGEKDNDLFRNKAILKMMDHLQSKLNYTRILEWSKKINPVNLDVKDFNGVSAEGKKFRKPSDKESYYLKLSKALEKCEKYNECISLCDEALKLFPEEIWFKWHKGVALRHLQKYDNAIELLKEVNRTKRDWFVFKELSACYYEKKEYENAFKYFIEGCIGSARVPNPENRWELYFLGGKILQKLNKNDIAAKHMIYTYRLREESGFKIQDFLQKEVAGNIEQDKRSSGEIMNELKVFWNSEQNNLSPRLTGTIKTLIKENSAGFITSDKGNDYYFLAKNFRGNRTDLVHGKQVEFSLRKSFDRLKNRESEEAINIRVKE